MPEQIKRDRLFSPFTTKLAEKSKKKYKITKLPDKDSLQGFPAPAAELPCLAFLRMEDNCLWRKIEQKIPAATIFDSEQDAADVFVSFIAQKHTGKTDNEYLAKTKEMKYNKDKIPSDRVPSGL